MDDKMETDAPSDGSITRCVRQLKAGDKSAAQLLWERYFDHLVRLARRRLALARRGADEDEEDAALSAFDSFCAGVSGGRFPKLDDREDLWRLLVVITARKAGAQVERRRAVKRGGDLYRIEGNVGESGESNEQEILIQIVSREPTPEFAAQVADQTSHLLNQLNDDGLKQIAVWRMEGYTADEIADRLGCARRTVARRLDLIRRIWSAEDESTETAA